MSLYTVQGLQKRCPGKISAQELYKRSLGKISARGVLARSQQISMQYLYAMSLYKISFSSTSSLEDSSWQDLCKRPLGKISATDLYAMCLYKISKRGVLARSLYKISIRGLLARLWKISLYKRFPQEISVRDLKVRSLFKLLEKISEKDRCSLHQVTCIKTNVKLFETIKIYSVARAINNIQHMQLAPASA